MRQISIPNFNKIEQKMTKLQGCKIWKNREKYEKKNVKNCCFFLITFLLLKIYDNIKNIKNWAWLQEHACQISEEYNEN